MSAIGRNPPWRPITQKSKHREHPEALQRARRLGMHQNPGLQSGVGSSQKTRRPKSQGKQRLATSGRMADGSILLDNSLLSRRGKSSGEHCSVMILNPMVGNTLGSQGHSKKESTSHK